jgi:Cu(I)/Ag(I) efflux system protein CusF
MNLQWSDAMKRKFFVMTLFTVMTLGAGATGVASAQALTDGEVKKVDASAKKITIKHGPMKKFDMDDSMTMVYGVQDPSLLAAVKAGDRIKFDAERANGQFVVTKIQKTR